MKTYCNPLPLPDYPRGMSTYGKEQDTSWWRRSGRRDFRETADPSVLYHDGAWYLYPSCGIAYVSTDFATWTHHPIEPRNPGYAPTIAKHRGAFLLTACNSPLWRAPHPLGPFERLGGFRKPDGSRLEGWLDPMIFPDEDGRLYLYWGISAPGIFGAELDPEDPTQLITEPKILFSHDPAHPWERSGDWNEDWDMNFNEGAWMFKRGGVYYLTYAGPGTQWTTYCMAAYVSDGPLGPFLPQRKNPFLATRHGLVNAPGHGCVVEGPGGSLWAFYTCLVNVNHMFERRIGMDPVWIDQDGDLASHGASELPGLLPGANAEPWKGNHAGLLPVTINRNCRASSEAPGRDAFYALDNSMRTWWQPAEGDPEPCLEINLQRNFSVSCARIIWTDEGLDYDRGVLPGPVRYVLEAALAEGGPWTPLCDRSASQQDMLIDYVEFAPATARRLRLRILGWPAGLRPALVSLTVFGISTAHPAMRREAQTGPST